MHESPDYHELLGLITHLSDTFCIYSVSTKKTANYFLAQHHQTATKQSNFCHSDLRDSCESAYVYVFHLTCVMLLPGKTFQNRVVEYNWSQIALNNCNS